MARARLPGAIWGLRTRVVALLVTMMVLLSAALAGFLPERLDQLSTRWSESRSLGIARLLGRLCAVPLDFDDRDTAAAMLADLRATRGIAYAVLYRPDGRPLASWNEPPAAAPEPGAGERIRYAGGLAHVSVPVVTRTGLRGSLTVGFELSELDERRREAGAIVTIAVALLLALGIPAAFAIGTLAIAPIRQVTRVALRISGGEAGARAELPVDRADEVGALASAFGVMLDRLYREEAAVRASADALERRVAQRTEELELANREIALRLSELTRTQEQLIAADRRISVGRLAAGVAHEINNPLAYIDGNLSFLGDALGELRGVLSSSARTSPRVAETVQEMVGAVADSRQGAARVRHIVRGLKTFSRDHEDERGPVSVRAAVEGALDMARHEVKHRAQLVTRLGELPEVEGNEVRLTQVFLNLVVNAAQAIPEGAPQLHEVRVVASTDVAGWAVVEVSDTGTGIPPEVRAHLFEPFFTTKPLGEGTGLGLSISRSLVERFGGKIEVESEVGKGSTFRVRLPPLGHRRVPGPAPAAARAGPRRRLLVVDDELLVCKALQRSLGRDHEVVAETSPRAALERLAAGERFDAILCDLMMPDVSGMQFREELQARAPEMADAVVFMTGGAVTEHGERFLAAEDTVWLQKPIDPDQLRRILDGPPA